MRLRVLLTNGTRTVDLIWLNHNGTDVYYGAVGWNSKSSYHESGKRHRKTKAGHRSEIKQHYRLDSFQRQLQLCGFAIETGIVENTKVTEYRGKKGDSVVWLDARTLPSQINVSLGLLEVGGYHEILPIHTLLNLHLVHLVTNTVPWIYVMVADVQLKQYEHRTT